MGLLDLFKEFSPLNFALSPLFSVIIVLLGIGLGVFAFMNKSVLSGFTTPEFSVLGFGVLFTLAGIILFLKKHGNNMVGRIASVFFIAGILNLAIFALSYYKLIVI